MAPYKEDFPRGSKVRIADRAFLENFLATWKYHNKLEPDQLAYADRDAVVRGVAFYHGGDVLYKLDRIPGTWHEACLRPMAHSAGVQPTPQAGSQTDKHFRWLLPIVQTLIAILFGGWGEWQRIQILNHSPFGFNSTTVYHVWPWWLKFVQVLNTPALFIGEMFGWPINNNWPKLPEYVQLVPVILLVPLLWYGTGLWLDFKCNAGDFGRNSRKLIWAAIFLFIVFSAVGATLSTYGSQLLYGIAVWIVIGVVIAASAIYKWFHSRRAQ
jgi:hypothetical protein